MNYCSLQEAWGHNDYISKQYKNYNDIPEKQIKKPDNIEKFSATEKKFKSHVKKINSCDNFIDHLNSCRHCQSYMRNKYRPKILENFSEIVDTNRDVIVLILVGISIMLFFNLVGSVTSNTNNQNQR